MQKQHSARNSLVYWDRKLCTTGANDRIDNEEMSSEDGTTHRNDLQPKSASLLLMLAFSAQRDVSTRWGLTPSGVR